MESVESKGLRSSRRGFLGLLAGAVAAPMIVRTPGLLMPLQPRLVVEPELLLTPTGIVEAAEQAAKLYPRNKLLTVDMITRDAIKMWRNSNEFIKFVDEEFKKDFDFSKGLQWTNIQTAQWKMKNGARIKFNRA